MSLASTGSEIVLECRGVGHLGEFHKENSPLRGLGSTRVLACHWPASPPDNTSRTGGQRCRRRLAKIRVTCVNANARFVSGEDAGHHTGTGVLPDPSFSTAA